MFIVFRTTITETLDHADEYQIVETSQEAADKLAEWQALDSTHCAGMAPIVAATEPHWIEGK